MFLGILTKGRHARLRVVDSGSGMTEEVARKIFTPFFTTKGPEKGTGLGLSSVMELVDAHRGGIHLRTAAGIGTTFMVLIPLADDEALDGIAAHPAPVVSSPAPQADIRTETRILIIDDEPLVADLGANVLLRAGYEVETFVDPLAGLARFESVPDFFDVIVTDQTMPKMTGLELVARIQLVRPNIPIVICTGHSSDVERTGTVPEVVKQVLRKPYSFEALRKAVQDALMV
jgi:CheY-like chemotaxis protein